MKITVHHTSTTAELPNLLATCKGTVSLILNDGQAYPLNSSPGTLHIFEKLWNCRDYSEAELLCENDQDISMLFDLTLQGKK